MTGGNTQKDGSGNYYWLLVDSDGRLIINDAWSPLLQAYEGLNDSDKSIIVTSGYEWKIQWIWIELTTTASAGDRQMVLEIQDAATDVVFQMRAGAVQAASLTRYYLFAPMGAEITSFRDTDFLYVPLPPVIHLPASYVIRIYDNNAVDAAADDMVVQMLVQQRS
jgi:hypothetical protein